MQQRQRLRPGRVFWNGQDKNFIAETHLSFAMSAAKTPGMRDLTTSPLLGRSVLAPGKASHKGRP